MKNNTNIELWIASQGRKIMCEFCIKHGDGKRWYLASKNYVEELTSSELVCSNDRVASIERTFRRSNEV